MAKSKMYAKRDRSRGDARWQGSGKGSFIARMLQRPAPNSRNNALLWGLAWLIIGVIGAWYFAIMPTSMIGYTVCGNVRLIWQLALGVAVWMSFGVVYFAFGVMRNRGTSLVEMFGRMLFAHWPITLLIVPGIFISRTAYATFMVNPGVAYLNYPTDTIIMAVVAVVVGLWTLYWGYLAFCRATQRSGFVSLLCYVIATPLAYYLSKLVVGAITKGI